MIRTLSALGAAALLLGASPARADSNTCHVIDVDFTPAPNLQIAVWLEDATGNYVQTIYLTALTGTYGIGNRPGLKDLNSAWHWPYGRREYVFPVWAHRHGLTFPEIGFQDGEDTDISHPFNESTPEAFFCRPLAQGEPMWDTQTCATSVFTDKGVFTSGTSLYPPRADIVERMYDSPSVAMYSQMNPFDTVSQATPLGGMDFTIAWPFPPTLAPGDYVMWAEVSQESDFNSTYNQTTYPSPTNPDGSPLPYANYGLAARGQPSIVYSVPFTVGDQIMTGATSTYAGYGDPEGATGTLHPPDATITTDTAGSGLSRFQLTADGSGGTFRLRVTSRVEQDNIPPAAPQDIAVATYDASSTTIDFSEPGDDGLIGKVSGYEVRYRAGSAISDVNFAQSTPAPVTLVPKGAGSVQSFTLDHLLPDTTYYVGVRAYDECKNYSPISVAKVTTGDVQPGYVDACFVATAAYGSLLANDVGMLRRFRDMYLRSNVLGELAVETYYSVGPAVAGVVDESEPLRGTARAALRPMVEFIGTMTGGR